LLKDIDEVNTLRGGLGIDGSIHAAMQKLPVMPLSLPYAITG